VFDTAGLQNLLFSAVSTQQRKKPRDVLRERVIAFLLAGQQKNGTEIQLLGHIEEHHKDTKFLSECFAIYRKTALCRKILRKERWKNEYLSDNT